MSHQSIGGRVMVIARCPDCDEKLLVVDPQQTRDPVVRWEGRERQTCQGCYRQLPDKLSATLEVEVA